MLNHLRRVTQTISIAENQQQMLELLVSEVCVALGVDACSVYVADDNLEYFVLTAAQGLPAECKGQTKVAYKQGLLSLIGQSDESFQLDNPEPEPSIENIPEIKNLKFKAFLGVPIIHRRKLFGILVVQQNKARRFEIDEETFLISLAAQISPALSRSNSEQLFDLNKNQGMSRNLQGIAASPGIAVGCAQVIFPSENIHVIPDRKADNINKELRALSAAVQATHNQLQEMCEQMQGKVSEEEVSLFKAYQQILGSKGLAEEVAEVIRQGYWAATALRKVVQNHLREFKTMQDPYLRERGSDLEDLANRVLTHLLSSNTSEQKVKPGSIVVCGNITAGMIAEIPMENVKGIVSLKGSATSHAAILAKALGIPAIMGLEACPITRMDGKQLILDGYKGTLYVAPEKHLLDEYNQLLTEEEKLNLQLTEAESLPNATKDGLLISLLINNSLGVDAEKVRNINVDGIGLFRTEISFMQLEKFPSEDQQTQMYRQIMQDFENLPVTIRTLDIGGDKQLNYFPIKEDNPFLGWRGVRISLDHPEIFLVQLRAIFRASVNRNGLKLALPMVSTTEELNGCIALIDKAFYQVQESLNNQNDFLHRPQIGLILEVPASVFQLENFAKRIDFISVGTNDLIQYLMAVDRSNLRVKNLYSHFQPAVLRVLKQIAVKCHELKLSAQICGEMAADPLAAIVLIGMGYYDLSMNIGSITKVRRCISQFTLAEMQQLVVDCEAFETESATKQHLIDMMESRGLGGLIRAGS